MTSFFLAWAYRVSSRFRDLRQEELSTASSGVELALRDRGERVDAFLQAEGVTVKPGRLRSWDAEAGSAGARAGDAVSLVRGEVSYA